MLHSFSNFLCSLKVTDYMLSRLVSFAGFFAGLKRLAGLSPAQCLAKKFAKKILAEIQTRISRFLEASAIFAWSCYE